MTDATADSTALVRVERRDDGVAVVRLDRPKVNALSLAMLAELAAAFEALHAELPGAVVVTGGERVFAAGFEISELPVGGDTGGVSRAFAGALERITSLPRFVLAAVNGVALGGGLELALACDWRIAAESSRFGLPEVLLGVIPGAGGTQRLPRLVGPARAKEMAITGRQVGAEEALRVGLVDEVVAADAVLDRALAKAGEVARGAVVAQGLIKAAVDRGMSGPLDAGLAYEADLFQQVHQTDDARIGVESFLANGPGKAAFTGR